jgi:hypothetical protein
MRHEQRDSVKDFTEGFLHQVKKQNPATSSNGESGDG